MNVRQKLLTSKELAPILGITSGTVLAWVRRGWIPSLRAGQRPILFDLDNVKAALQQRAREHHKGGATNGE